MDEKEEGEISLEDVSSSDEGPYPGPWDRALPSRRYHSMRETVHGKENRHYPREVYTTRYTFPTLHEKNDDLLPISSDDDLEIVEIPDSSHQLRIHVSRKKRKKKKKKKVSGMTFDDFVSVADVDPTVLNKPREQTPSEVVVHRSRRQSSSPRRSHYSPPFIRPRHFSRSPPRSPIRSPPRFHRAAFRRSPSPRNRYSRSPSPRRRRSPRKSPIFRRERSPRRHRSPESYHDVYASSLLKKVRRLETVGVSSPTNAKQKESKSLKEKLSNMMRQAPSPPDISTHPEEKSDESSENAGEEDNVELLRKLALSTKHTKAELKNEHSQKNKKKSGNLKHGEHHAIEPDHLSDNDHEDLELRMIALKSAMLKKHQKRVKKNPKLKNPFHSPREMSPLGLCDDSESGENSGDSRSQGQVEDMELDTDIENERDFEPYSPTDEVMRNLPEEDVGNVSVLKIEARIDEDSPYSPTDPTKTPYVDRFKKERRKIEEILVEDSDSCGEVPYSPSDTPVYDPELPHCPLEFLVTPNDTVLDLSTKEKRDDDSIKTEKVSEVRVKVEPDEDLDGVPMEIEEKEVKNIINIEKPEKIINNKHRVVRIFKKTPEVNKNLESSQKNVEIQQKIAGESSGVPESPQSPENNEKSGENVEKPANLSVSSENSVPKPLKSLSEILLNSLTENSSGNSSDKIVQRAMEVTGEPLYLRGIPGVTKEPNKIPTLVNKSLVPVSILKTNKNLQQPLPPKKIDSPVEPSFKSAQMQPVEDEPMTNKSASFKPIKVQSVMKKPTVLPPPPEFNSSLLEETLEEVEKSAENDNKNQQTHDNNKNEKIQKNQKIQEDKENDVNDADSSQVSHEETTSEKESVTPGPKKKRRTRKPGKPSRARKLYKHMAKCLARKEAASGEKSSKSLENDSVSENSAKSAEVESSNEKIADKHKEKSPGEGDKSEKVSEKKRRNSIEEDEETLRAILLASLAKRPKVVESVQKSPQKGSEPPEALIAGSSNSEPKKNSEVNEKITETAQKASQVSPDALKDKKSVAQSSTSEKTPEVSPKSSEIVAKPQNTSTPVEKSTVSIQKPVDSAVSIQKPANSAISEAKKRLNSVPIKGPPRKIIKSIPVSTKVVNNAKKFQNTMLQKKLILQNQTKLISTSKNLVFNNVKPMDVSKPSSSGKLQRLVINLGEDSDTESESSSGESRNETAARAELAIPTTDFEKSVDQFLKDQRKKQEMMAANSVSSASSSKKGVTSVVRKSVESSSTPLAVRHLPPSQQEEYKRLKQQILEKERQRANRQTTANNTPPGPLSPASPAAVKLTKPTLSPKNMPIPSKDVITSTPEAKGTVTAGQTIQKAAQKAIPTNISTAESSKSGSIDKPTFVVSNLSSAARKVMENLSIQIPNDNLSSGVRIVAKKSEIIENTLQKASEKILEKKSENTLQKTLERTLQTDLQKNSEKTVEETSEKSSENILEKTLEKSPETTLENSVVIISETPVEKAPQISEKPAQISEKTPPALKILTTNDLNLKLAKVHLKRIDLNNTVVNHDQSMGELLSSIDDCDNSVKNPADFDENSTVIGEKSNFNETNNRNQTNDATVDSQASTVILPPREGVESLQNESGETTIVLDDTIEQRSPQVSRSPRMKSKSPVKEHSERIKSDVKAELENFAMLSGEEQRERLKDVEENLVKKRYAILDDLTDMSSTLKQWDVERELQTNLFAEVKRLRAQLAVAEERLQEQRVKIDGIAPKVTKAHKTIIHGRAECLKLTKLCQGIGSKVVGQEYKVPSTAAQLMMERLKEVAFHTRQLSKKKVPCGPNNNPEDSSSADESSTIRERTISLESVSSEKEQSDDGNIDNANSDVSDDASGVVISRLSRPVIDNLPSGEESRPLSEHSAEPKEKEHLMSHYESVFTNVMTPRHIDLHRELCPFELSGQCKDADCRYNHLDETRKQ